jgi:hypothetical protein
VSDAIEPDELVPDPKVSREFGVSAMTLWRWDRDPQLAQLGWPAPIEIRRRKFRSRKQLESFKAKMLRNALKERPQAAEVPERLRRVRRYPSRGSRPRSQDRAQGAP